MMTTKEQIEQLYGEYRKVIDNICKDYIEMCQGEDIDDLIKWGYYDTFRQACDIVSHKAFPKYAMINGDTVICPSEVII